MMTLSHALVVLCFICRIYPSSITLRLLLICYRHAIACPHSFGNRVGFADMRPANSIDELQIDCVFKMATEDSVLIAL